MTYGEGWGEVRSSHDKIETMSDRNLVALARKLRKNQTDAETLLWSKLRSHQLDGYKFKRQVPFGGYILDFYCRKAQLAIEIDGGQHTEQEISSSDEIRTNFLNNKGIRVLRFWNHQVLQSIDVVVDEISSHMRDDMDA